MAATSFPRVVRGYAPDAVNARFAELEAEVELLRAELAEATDRNTELRLSVIKQIEEASAEAAVVLGHARSEAIRIREAAVRESEAVLDKAKRTSQDLTEEATQLREDALVEREAHKASAAEMIDRAKSEAQEILAEAKAKALSLEADSLAAKGESGRRIQEMENDLRLQKLELDRIEADVREQADSYAMRVYREADEYHRTIERRALELEKQAEEILHLARVNAHDHRAAALGEARRYLEDALGLVNTIFSEVNGSLLDVQRIRSVLGESLDRITRQEGNQALLAAGSDDPADASEPAEPSHS